MASAFVKSERLQKLPPYLFAEIDRKKKAAIAAGKDVINLGVGDPDRPTPKPIIESLQKNAEVRFPQTLRNRPRSSLGNPPPDRLQGRSGTLPSSRPQSR